MGIKQRIAGCYKVHRMTAFIDEDLKSIKKVNQFLVKLEKNPYKETYILEIINILRTLLNLMNFNPLFLVMCEIIDMKYHEVLSYLLCEVDSLNSPDAINVIRKFKELAEQNILFTEDGNE